MRNNREENSYQTNENTHNKMNKNEKYKENKIEVNED